MLTRSDDLDMALALAMVHRNERAVANRREASLERGTTALMSAHRKALARIRELEAELEMERRARLAAEINLDLLTRN